MASMLPFVIQRFVFNAKGEAEIANLDKPEGTPGTIPGYFVMSSAPPDIDPKIDPKPDEKPEFTPAQQQQYAQQGVQEIADHLYGMMTTHPGGNAELVITVHGYNTSRRGVQAWYQKIFQYVNHRYDEALAQQLEPPAKQPNRVFVGYRWPSENVELGRFPEAIRALPPLPRNLLLTGGAALVLLVIFQFIAFGGTLGGRLLSLAFGLFTALGLLMFALVVLRLVVYFRDNYRANNFGVLDLVELLRQIDYALVQRTAEERFAHLRSTNPSQAEAEAQTYWANSDQKHKIKLSFIGHSMGAFVVTNVVRILSDVFDSSSINKRPDSNIGDVFRLERLVLASPDIPVLAIITSRANFLASSLRRFSESYLFSSEGDIALRIASTAANYIAFPSRTQERGYRLGNVALKSPSGHPNPYGLMNLPSLCNLATDPPGNRIVGAAKAQQDPAKPKDNGQAKDNVMTALFLTFRRSERNGVLTLADLFEDPSSGSTSQGTDPKGGFTTIADLFTYFDCTDYVDVCYNAANKTCSAKPTGLLTRAKRKPVLKSWDYFLLTLDYALGKRDIGGDYASGKRDVHGGYFEGKFSQDLLYGLAFLGFSGYLKTLNADSQVALSQLHVACKEKGIQGYLSPFRYRVDIQGENLENTREEMLQVIEKNAEPAMDSPGSIPDETDQA